MDPARPDPRHLPSPHGAPSPSSSAPRHSHPPVADAHPGLGAARSRPIRPGVAAKDLRGIVTSAIWNVTALGRETTFALILMGEPVGSAAGPIRPGGPSN